MFRTQAVRLLISPVKVPALETTEIEGLVEEASVPAELSEPGLETVTERLKQQPVRRPLLLCRQRGVERAQGTQQLIDAGALVFQPLLTLFQPFHDARRRAPVIVSPATVPPPIVSPTKAIALIDNAVADRLGLLAHGVGKIIPQALLACRDAKPGMEKIEPSLEPVLGRLRLPSVAPVEAAAISAILLGLWLGRWLVFRRLC
jgi:hypothetical protein